MIVRSSVARIFLRGLLCLFAVCCCRCEQAHAEVAPEIQIAIDRGLDSLRSYNYSFKAVTGLVVYTLLVGGDEPDSPAVATGLKIIEGKFDGETGAYKPLQHHIYEAAIDSMALEKADRNRHQAELEAIAAYLIDQQEAHGGWYYPNQGGRNNGDTSITQYAVLGLWAAERAGITMPDETLLNAMRWHTTTQNKNGGFSYHPKPGNNNTTGTMTVAGAGSLGILRILMAGGPDLSANKKGSSRKFGVLEVVQPKDNAKARSTINPRQVRPILTAAINRAGLWIAGRFLADSVADHDGFLYYYYYTLERAAAVNAWETVNGVDWYEHGAKILLEKQGPDGRWAESRSRGSLAPSGTCFALLFLMKSTQKLLPQRETVETFGDGVLAGGRGLPDDLTRVEFRNGRVETEQKMGEFNTLLQGLSQVELEADKPEKAAETVDLSRPEQLIGDIPVLKRLAGHDDSRVRQVAAWGLGRSDDLSAAAPLLLLLADENLDVAVEARAAMCRLSRRPNGFGLEPDPRLFVPPTLTADERTARIEEWRTEVATRWRTWYLQNRPYSERDDFDDPLQRPYRGARE